MCVRVCVCVSENLFEAGLLEVLVPDGGGTMIMGMIMVMIMGPHVVVVVGG